MEPVQNPRILVTRRVPGDWEAMLRDTGGTLLLPEDPTDRAMPREEFLRKVHGCHGVGSMLTDRWDGEAFDAAGPQLRIIANFAVGYNNIDLGEAARRGVMVGNTPDVLTEATADIAWALLLAAARRLGEGERVVRTGRFHGWGPSDFIGVDLVGRTLGIIGPGRIGRAIARRATGWRMQLVYTHPSRRLDFKDEFHGARHATLEELLRSSDFVSINTPLNEKTRHLIGARELALMKPTAVLVNTSRGPVINENALVEALREKRIFAAGLDVYEEEPKLAEGLTKLENVVLLPHVGSATLEARGGMARIMAENLLAAMEGRRPPHLVAAQGARP